MATILKIFGEHCLLTNLTQISARSIFVQNVTALGLKLQAVPCSQGSIMLYIFQRDIMFEVFAYFQISQNLHVLISISIYV